MQTEQGVLRASIAVTLLISAFGITFGLLSGSFSIAFDGIYALVDASMSVLALIVANLIASYTSSRAAAGPLKARFSTGFWHLEPIVLGLNGVLLVAVSVYALVNAIGSLLMGGHALEFDFAIIYAVVTLIACTVMAVLETKANRTIRSDFVGLDAKAWMMSGGITAALLVAFCGGYLVQGTRLEWISPYIDPAVLALVCAVIIPLPVSNIRQALTDILLVAPDDLTAHVHEVAKGVLKDYGFLSYRAYIAKVGRAKQVELYFIVPTGLPPRRVEEWDAVRDRIGDAIGHESPDRWLTIAFTADPAWAD